MKNNSLAVVVEMRTRGHWACAFSTYNAPLTCIQYTATQYGDGSSGTGSSVHCYSGLLLFSMPRSGRLGDLQVKSSDLHPISGGTNL